MLIEIIKFFQTGVPPVTPAETIEIFAFMAAAAESKKLNGETILIESVINEASREAVSKMDL